MTVAALTFRLQRGDALVDVRDDRPDLKFSQGRHVHNPLRNGACGQWLTTVERGKDFCDGVQCAEHRQEIRLFHAVSLGA
jgi:hypothetical protein